MAITSAISASELLLEGKISLEKESPNESWKPLRLGTRTLLSPAGRKCCDPAPPQPQQPPVHQPPLQEHTGEHMSLENWERLLQNHKEVAAVIQEIHRELHTRILGGFQAERLTKMLEERHGGGERMGEILQSLQTERRHNPYFWEVQTDFRNLRGSGGTEMQLQKEWQGRA
ncbi:hypothetical protein KY285_010724 [Solanum tuberosum]|nr:hypothetical protein KY289_011306 [Solanum tuberosum]KAH0735017.1 hypothetical protein KY285_010724 [Solanum tuberosum]